MRPAGLSNRCLYRSAVAGLKGGDRNFVLSVEYGSELLAHLMLLVAHLAKLVQDALQLLTQVTPKPSFSANGGAMSERGEIRC